MPTGVYVRTKPIHRKYPNGEQPKNPRIPRDKDLRYKLTEPDIKDIKKLYRTGRYTHQALASQYGVSTSTICYYVNDRFRQYQMEKNRQKKSGCNMQKYTERKKELFGDEFRKYNALRARKLRGTLNKFAF